MKKEFKYSEALREIEEIISEIEDESIDIDVLTEKVRRVITLIKACKARLRATEEDLKNVLKDLSDDKPIASPPPAGSGGASGLFD